MILECPYCKEEKMILECPYCKEEILTKYPIKNNRVDDRDMEKVYKHLKIKHPKVKIET